MHKITSESNRLLFVMKRRIDHVAASLRNAVVDGNRRAAFVAVKALRWLSSFDGSRWLQYGVTAATMASSYHYPNHS